MSLRSQGFCTNLPEGGEMRILLAVDGSARSLAAAREAARRPWPPGSIVKVISALKPHFMPADETRSLPESCYPL